MCAGLKARFLTAAKRRRAGVESAPELVCLLSFGLHLALGALLGGLFFGLECLASLPGLGFGFFEPFFRLLQILFYGVNANAGSLDRLFGLRGLKLQGSDFGGGYRLGLLGSGHGSVIDSSGPAGVDPMRVALKMSLGRNIAVARPATPQMLRFQRQSHPPEALATSNPTISFSPLFVEARLDLGKRTGESRT
jgi:hypothetical protein